MRADVLLVERGLAPSRTAAQRLIAGGHVYTRVGRKGTRVALTKPGVTLDDDVAIEVEASELDRYVSRGGLKLESALAHCGLDVAGLRCLDVGQSTGGFTDCLLQRGAAHVTGVDVGHDQLHASLRADARVTAIEGVNARTLDATVFASATPVGAGLPAKAQGDQALVPPGIRGQARSHRGEAGSDALSVGAGSPAIAQGDEAPMPPGIRGQARSHSDLAAFDLIVADVSFISLTKVLPQWPALLRAGGRVLSLVKPQFEVGAAHIGRGGIVRDASLYATVERDIRAACAGAGLTVLDYFASSITGGDGNREFFVYARTS